MITGLLDLNTFLVTFLSGVACKYWQGLNNLFQSDGGLTDMSTEKDFCKLTFMKKEDPKKYVTEYFEDY